MMEIGAAIMGRCAAFARRWERWRATRRERRAQRASCEKREQRLEEADTPGCALSELHALVSVAFAPVVTSTERADLEPLLEEYADLAISRRRHRAALHRDDMHALRMNRDRARRDGRVLSVEVLDRRIERYERCEACVRAFDQQLAEIDALIRLCCERAIYARAGVLQSARPRRRDLVRDHDEPSVEPNLGQRRASTGSQT